jgi:hypothetical protein
VEDEPDSPPAPAADAAAGAPGSHVRGPYYQNWVSYYNLFGVQKGKWRALVKQYGRPTALCIGYHLARQRVFDAKRRRAAEENSHG